MTFKVGKVLKKISSQCTEAFKNVEMCALTHTWAIAFPFEWVNGLLCVPMCCTSSIFVDDCTKNAYKLHIE